MTLQVIDNNTILHNGDKVIHKATLEVGTYIGECIGFGK